MKKKFVIGFVFFFFGVAIVLSSMTGMTGFVISNNLSTSLNAILGLVPIVAGLIIIFSERGKDSNETSSQYRFQPKSESNYGNFMEKK